MKIVFVISSLSGGGAQRIVSDMANYWSEAGHAIVILTFDDGSVAHYTLLTSIQRLPLNIAGQSSSWTRGLFNSLRRIRCLRRALKETKPDVVVSFLYTTNILTILAAMFLPCPIIISERNAPVHDGSQRSVWRMLRRLLYPSSDHLVVQTDAIKKYFQRYNKSVQVIPNPITIPPEKIAEKPEINLPPGKKIVAMGRFTRQKGFDMLIEIFAKLQKHHNDWNLIILGEGCLREAMKKKAEELKINDAVCMPGRAVNPFSILASCDLFVLASRYEGFPNSLLEAMACGLPAVSFNCTYGPADIIQHNVNGLLVEPEDTDGLEKAIRNLMEDEPLRKEMGRNARRITEKFSQEKIMGQWDKLICAQ